MMGSGIAGAWSVSGNNAMAYAGAATTFLQRMGRPSDFVTFALGLLVMVLGIGVGYAVWAGLVSLSITLAATAAVACAAIIVRHRRTNRTPT